jgi:hypothetical protein
MVKFEQPPDMKDHRFDFPEALWCVERQTSQRVTDLSPGHRAGTAPQLSPGVEDISATLMSHFNDFNSSRKPSSDNPFKRSALSHYCAAHSSTRNVGFRTLPPVAFRTEGITSLGKTESST